MLKRIFKPTKSKLILFAIIFIVGQIFLTQTIIANDTHCKAYACTEGSSYHYIWMSCQNCGTPTINEKIINIATYAFNPFIEIARNKLTYMILQETLSIIYWYILSCLIIIGYNKLKNKK